MKCPVVQLYFNAGSAQRFIEFCLSKRKRFINNPRCTAKTTPKEMKERYNPVFDSINEDSLSVRKTKGENAVQTLLYSICLLQ